MLFSLVSSAGKRDSNPPCGNGPKGPDAQWGSPECGLEIGLEQILAVEFVDHVHGFLRGIYQSEEVHVLWRNVLVLFQYTLFEPIDQTLPKVTAHQDDGEASDLFSLNERQCFKEITKTIRL